jgi:hypothetical protein
MKVKVFVGSMVSQTLRPVMVEEDATVAEVAREYLADDMEGQYQVLINGQVAVEREKVKENGRITVMPTNMKSGMVSLS